MAQKPERIRTLGCGGLIRLAMELDKNDYKHDEVIMDVTAGKKPGEKGETHIRVGLAESACRKLAALLTSYADKLAAARVGQAAAAKKTDSAAVSETKSKVEKDAATTK